MGVRSIAVVLLFLLFACGSVRQIQYESFTPNEMADSEKIQYYVDTMNYEYYQAELNENWRQSLIDSLVEDQQFGLKDGTVRYAPDNSFRIFCLEGEQCGAYCNPLYETVIEFANPTIEKSYINTPTITNIVKVTDTTYLLNGSGYARPSSFYSVDIEMLHYFVLTPDTAYFIPFPGIEIGEFDPTGGFLMFQEFFLEDDMIKDYDTEKMQVTYEYRRNYEADYGKDIDSLFTGKFQLGGKEISWIENSAVKTVANKSVGW